MTKGTAIDYLHIFEDAIEVVEIISVKEKTDEKEQQPRRG